MRFYYWTGEFAINNILASIIIPSTISERSFTMFRYALPFALPVTLAFLLTACGHEEAPPVSVRPAMVVKPEPSTQ
jgi:multidrug efflux system membrane fusion protein